MENTAQDVGFQGGLKDSEGVCGIRKSCNVSEGWKKPNKPHQEWLNVKRESAQDVMQAREAWGKAQLDTAQSKGPSSCGSWQGGAQGRVTTSPRERVLACGKTTQRREKINEQTNKQQFVSVLWGRNSLVSQVQTPRPAAGPPARMAMAACGYLSLGHHLNQYPQIIRMSTPPWTTYSHHHPAPCFPATAGPGI